MSRFCETCGRGAQSAQTVSHANNKTKTRKLVNIQVKRIAGKAYRMCTRCLRTLTKKPTFIETLGVVERRLVNRHKRKATTNRAKTKQKTHPEK